MIYYWPERGTDGIFESHWFMQASIGGEGENTPFIREQMTAEAMMVFGLEGWAESGERDAAMDTMQDDIAEILRLLGLGDHARPESPHQVVRNEVIPAIRALREAASGALEALRYVEGKKLPEFERGWNEEIMALEAALPARRDRMDNTVDGVDAHNLDDLKAVLAKGEEKKISLVTCSWGILSVRRKSTKEWTTLLLFFDRDTLEPFFIYDFGSDTVSLKAMAARLVKTKHFADDMRENFGI